MSQPKEMSAHAKPPIGLRPLFLAVEQRMEEIRQVRHRYLDAGITPPDTWEQEFNLLRELRTIVRVNSTLACGLAERIAATCREDN